MSVVTAYDVFNGKAIAIGSFTIVVCMLLQAILFHIVTSTIKPLIARLVTVKSLLEAQ
jgi:hypothetical protein